MQGHIQKKFRYKYYNSYKTYLNSDILNIIVNSDNKRNNKNIRFLYFNNIYNYYNPLALIVHTSGKSNNIDLTSNSLLIKSSNSSTQTSNDFNDFNCFNKDICKEKNIINTFNVLDLLMPSFKIPKPIEKTKILPIEYTDAEKNYDFKILENKIEDIDDLITLGEQYKTNIVSKEKRYNLNLRVLSDMVNPLKELNNMIGMDNIKQSIFNKIILFLQGLDNINKDYQHIVLCGGPGMGKTEVAKIIGKIYSKMGILSKGDFKEVKLTDLKAGYVGQSEIKTQKILDEAKGCVLFIDEAYSIGSNDKIDSYSQGILDLINPYLDKNKNDFILIIAGYKDDLLSRFFRGNQGLKSRFGLWLEIDKYSGNDLKKIFIKKIRDYEWIINDNEIDDKFFTEHKEHFKFYGRDIENFFSKCKLAHAKRVLFDLPESKKIILKEDIMNGYKIYKKELNIDNEKKNSIIESMYS